MRDDALSGLRDGRDDASRQHHRHVERHVGEVAGARDHHDCGTVSHKALRGTDHERVECVAANLHGSNRR